MISNTVTMLFVPERLRTPHELHDCAENALNRVKAVFSPSGAANLFSVPAKKWFLFEGDQSPSLGFGEGVVSISFFHLP